MSSRTTEFSLSTSIKAPLSRVYSILSTPTEFIGLQPFVVHCDVVHKEVDSKTGSLTYELYYIERLKIVGSLAYRNRIHVFMTANPSAGRIEFKVHSVPSVDLHSQYQISENPAGITVAQTVSISCPRLLQSYVVKMARTAQEQLLVNLRHRVEAT